MSVVELVKAQAAGDDRDRNLVQRPAFSVSVGA
jgi:hypothetical protein